VFLAWALLGLAPSGITIFSSLSVALLTLMYASVAMLTYRRWLLRSLAILPIASLLDIILLHESMVRYEFFEVVWKERNICMPVMQRVRASPGQPVPQLDA
jgi:hypothetical protein